VSVATLVVVPNARKIITFKEENVSKILVQVSLDAFIAMIPKHATLAILIMALWRLMLKDSANATRTNGSARTKVIALTAAL
jgi:hypothetical protein